MKYTLAFIAIIIGLIILPGCLELTEPASDPMLSSANLDLCGVWQRAEGDSVAPEHLFVGAHASEAETPQGLMEFYALSYDDSSKRLGAAEYQFFTTDLKGSQYANLLLGQDKVDLGTKQKYDAWKAQISHPVGLIKFEAKGGQLTIWMGSDEVLKSLKTDKTIDESTASLIAYIKKDGDSKLFPDANKSVYRHAH